MCVYYDGGGGLLQPSITFSRDPFRFSIDYSILEAGSLKGGSGISLLHDRDNVQFRLEYVLKLRAPSPLPDLRDDDGVGRCSGCASGP